MYHIAICDDMPEESAKLESLLREYEQKHSLKFSIEVFSNGFIFIDEIISKRHFNLCFLDIFMPGFSGLDTAKELRTMDKEIQLIFCTTATQYALDGYGVQAVNYLVKPVKKEKLFTAMDQVLKNYSQDKEQVLWLQTATGLQKVTHSQIYYIEPEGNCSRLVLGDDDFLFCRLSFSELCETLTKYPNFALISRSILLNYDTVQGLDGNNFLLGLQKPVTIPRRKKKEVTQAFLDYSLGEQ